MLDGDKWLQPYFGMEPVNEEYRVPRNSAWEIKKYLEQMHTEGLRN
jgi:hypothetical protein